MTLPDTARDTERNEIALQFADIRPYYGASIIVADPPWEHVDWSKRGNKAKTPGHQYQTQSLDWIKDLPVHVLTGKNTLLWLWTTAPLMRVAMDVVDAWGFTYSTCGVWVKRTKTGKLAYGMGRRFRSCHEPFILATKGRARVKKAVRSVIEIAQDAADPIAEMGWTVEAIRREHSRKPDEAYEAARQCVEGPAVELFAREARPGWKVWGNEIGKFAEAAE